MKPLTYIDLFAGAGGLSEGFVNENFKPVAHVEMDEAACYTLKTRIAYHHLKSIGRKDIYRDYLTGSISREKLYTYIPDELRESVVNLPIGAEHNPKIHKNIDKLLNNKQVDLIIGGPPCQAYSLVGRARSEDNMKGDSRNYLYVQYAKYLERYSPKMFVFENVIGLKSAGKGIYLENMKRLFLKKGYEFKLFTVSAVDFGVLQNRKRVIIVGWQKHLNIDVPDLEKIKLSTGHKIANLFEDLPMIAAGEGNDKFQNYAGPINDCLKKKFIRNGIDVLTQHVARPHTDQDKKIYQIVVKKWNDGQKRLDYNDLHTSLKTHSNRTSFIDRFKVVADNLEYSQTVVAHIAKDGHYYIHPDIKQNRSITVREAARLQSFPDDYYFEGVKEGANRTASFKQIGNAVPPLMALKIAEIMKELLCQKK